MSKQTYNDQTITRYLLGSLPEVEAEHYDELSFTDDEFAESLKAAEKDLIDAYTENELTGEELEQLKSHYLASPIRREKVKFAQAFRSLSEKDAQAQVGAVRSETLPRSATKRKGSGWFSALSFFTGPRPALQWGLAAAALALMIAGGWLVFENARLRQQVSETQPSRDALLQREEELRRELERQRSLSTQTEQELTRARDDRARLEVELKQQEQQRAAKQQAPASSSVSIASFVLVPQMRGAGQIQTISIPVDKNFVGMRLDLEPGDHAAYRVALLNQSNNQALWRSGKLRARVTGNGKALGVSFRADLLKPQVYVLRVTGVSASGASDIVGDYPFRVVR